MVADLTLTSQPAAAPADMVPSDLEQVTQRELQVDNVSRCVQVAALTFEITVLISGEKAGWQKGQQGPCDSSLHSRAWRAGVGELLL